MALFRQIHTKIWADTWFEDQDPTAKLFFIYLFSNEQTSPSGVYPISISRMAFETGILVTTIIDLLDRFRKDGKIMWDGNASVVWVTNMREYNGTESPKLLVKIESDLSHIPHCPLMVSYRERYPMDTVSSGDVYPMDTVSAPETGDRKPETRNQRSETRNQTGDAPPSADALAASTPDSLESQSRSPPDPAMRGRYRERMVTLWESKKGAPITDQDAKQLVSWCNEHGTNTVWTAMQKALAANANNLGGYMRTVLESQQTRGP